MTEKIICMVATLVLYFAAYSLYWMVAWVINQPHLLFPFLFVIALTFWWALYKLTNKILDKFER